MNFLQLCQRLRQEVGASGSGPASVALQSGEYKRLVDWIATADEDVQRAENDWRFMVGSFSLDTVASTPSYLPSVFVTPVTDLRDYKRDSLKIYQTSTADETPLPYTDYQDWYRRFNTTAQTTGRPYCFSVGDDLALLPGPLPGAAYRITGKYHKSVTTLSADASTPPYPAEFHMLAVYRAMMKYGRFSGAIEVYQDGETEYKKMLSQMRRTQLPEVTAAEPLA